LPVNSENEKGSGIMKAISCALLDRLRRLALDPAEVAQMVEVLNGLASLPMTPFACWSAVC
jgi:hypothetical protein